MTSANETKATTETAWASVAEDLIDGIFAAPDPDVAVDRFFATLGPAPTHGDVIDLGEALTALGERSSDPDRVQACSTLVECLHKSAAPKATRLELVAMFTVIIALVLVVGLYLRQPVAAGFAAAAALWLIATLAPHLQRERWSNRSGPARLPDHVTLRSHVAGMIGDAESVVVCPDESSARAEAAQREALDPERNLYYWHAVCLEGEWVAKRYPRAGAKMPEQSWTDAITDGLFLR